MENNYVVLDEDQEVFVRLFDGKHHGVVTSKVAGLRALFDSSPTVELLSMTPTTTVWSPVVGIESAGSVEDAHRLRMTVGRRSDYFLVDQLVCVSRPEFDVTILSRDLIWRSSIRMKSGVFVRQVLPDTKLSEDRRSNPVFSLQSLPASKVKEERHKGTTRRSILTLQNGFNVILSSGVTVQ